MAALDGLAERCCFVARGFLTSDPEVLRQAAAALDRRELARVEEALSGDPGELEKEYVRLFLSPSGAPCPLWQSAYSEEGLLMGDDHASALEWYRAHGLEPVHDTEPADHAGLLLAFYAHLLESDVSPADLAAFHKRHLSWLSQLCNRIAVHTQHPFYRLLATMTRELVEGAPEAAARVPDGPSGA
ncbi:MAG: molecular chaperone TorD family protein [Bryobacteraceae bacterium]|jgi:TorA maturation chaperone TorD|nr:molecular chaperone TorD family protein [Bryobacteraceae bacterium]